MRQKKGEKRKPSHIRLYLSLLVFLLDVLIIVGIFVSLFFFEVFRYYVAVPLLIFYILTVITAIFITYSKVQTDFKVSWLAIIAIVPIGGIIIYLMFAQKITTRRMKKLRVNKINSMLIENRDDSTLELSSLKTANLDAYRVSNYIYQNLYASLYRNTKTEYFPLGQDGFPKIIEELKKAKKFIFIEYFIIEGGLMFDEIYSILEEKAKDGLDVRLIYDDFGTIGKIDANFFKKARQTSIKCFAFNRVRPSLDIRQNSRDHRKLIIIDGCVGFTGGCNLADEYINKKERFGVWKDNFLMLKGEAVNGLTSLFLSSWVLYSKVPEDIKPYSYKENTKNKYYEYRGGYVQPFGELPFDAEDGVKSVYLAMISKAKKCIYISSPYLTIDTELLTALKFAAKAKVDVRIVTPGIPDKKIVNQLTKSYYSELMLSGIKIYEYTPGFNHAKIIVVDGECAMTGTANFDFRSLYLNFESMVFFYGDSIVKKLEDDMKDMIDSSKEQKLEDYIDRPLYIKIIWGILRIFAPLI